MYYAVICASNQNRSMEAHYLLAKGGYQVKSYGTNSMIKLPGTAPDRPNTYPFSGNTTYASIQADLRTKDAEFYQGNGLLLLLDRNRQIKPAPERFQDRPFYPEDPEFDVIITCEERCFDIVNEDLLARGMRRGRSVWVINFEIKDTPMDAAVGAQAILQTVRAIEKAGSEEGIARVLDELQMKQSNISVLYTVHFL
jgi:RNA polymerase II subunit A C-terminal domain phosphatase SSU72